MANTLNRDPLGVILPVRVLERVLVLERRTGGVHAAAIRAVLPLLLEVSREVAAAHLRVPGAVPHVVPASETDDVDVARGVQRFQRLDRAVAPVRAGNDDLGVLIGEDLPHALEEVLVLLLVLHNLLALLRVVLRLGQNQRHFVDLAAEVVRGERSRVVADLVNLRLAADVQDVVPVVGEKAARFFPVRDAGVGVIRADRRDVLRVRGEVQRARRHVLQVAAERGLRGEGDAGRRDGLGGAERLGGDARGGGGGGHLVCVDSYDGDPCR
mmetsp:Transcript_8971/g.38001  ORF Transcript_8971/g.38001 Transcript_8971/m.38001 type:complete len:269 (+) Transcript_8971:104-910(+)